MRQAIALLITLFFIMLITLLIGVGLGYLNTLSKESTKEHFMLQSRVIVDDVLHILKTSKEIEQVISDTNSSEAFYTFLSQSGFIPLQHEGFEITLQIHSARDKINPNTLTNPNSSLNEKRVATLRSYLNLMRVDIHYADVMLDAMRGVREDYSYYSDLINTHPHLVKDSITSLAHQKELSKYFIQEYRYDTLSNIPFEELFFYAKQRDTKIDLNFATKETWMFLLGCDVTRAQSILEKSGLCQDFACLELSQEEQELVERFETSFYEPIVAIKLHLRQEAMQAYIAFEYNLQTKKGSHFVYKI